MYVVFMDYFGKRKDMLICKTEEKAKEFLNDFRRLSSKNGIFATYGYYKCTNYIIGEGGR